MLPIFQRYVALCALLMISGEICAWEDGDWTLEVGASHVDPSVKVDALYSLSLNDTHLVGRINPGASLILDRNMARLWSKHIGTEVMVSSMYQTAGGADAVLDHTLDAWLLPPSLSLQYQFFSRSDIQPYVGMELNYTAFSDRSLGLDYGAPGNRVRLENAFGYTLRAGVDFKLRDRWHVNLDVRYIDLEIDARMWGFNADRTAVNGIKLDPWTYRIDFVRRF